MTRTDERTILSGPAVHRLMFQYSLEAEDSLLIHMRGINRGHPIFVYEDGGKGDEKRPKHGCLFYLSSSIIYLSTLVSTKTVLFTITNTKHSVKSWHLLIST